MTARGWPTCDRGQGSFVLRPDCLKHQHTLIHPVVSHMGGRVCGGNTAIVVAVAAGVALGAAIFGTIGFLHIATVGVDVPSACRQSQLLNHFLLSSLCADGVSTFGWKVKGSRQQHSVAVVRVGVGVGVSGGMGDRGFATYRCYPVRVVSRQGHMGRGLCVGVVAPVV